MQAHSRNKTGLLYRVLVLVGEGGPHSPQLLSNLAGRSLLLAILMMQGFGKRGQEMRSGLFFRPSTMKQVKVEFVTGRGGAGFHSPGPALTTGRGGYFGGDPRPAPVRGESPLIPWMGARFSPPVLTGTCLGNGRGRGQGQGTVK